MLHNLEVGGKPLTVKVDENTKEYLENYKKDKSGDDGDQVCNNLNFIFINFANLNHPQSMAKGNRLKMTFFAFGNA